jgi:transcriptional regulator with XRE-family HTH domain
MTQDRAAKLAADGPPDVSSQVGERIADYRRLRGLKVAELARRVGVTGSLISQIERGRARPSISTLFLLGEALDVSLDAFFRDDEAAQALAPRRGAPHGRAAGRRAPDELAPPTTRDRFLVRAGVRASLEIQGGVRWERLTPENLDEGEFLEAVYAPGSESSPELYRHPGSEWVFILEGILEITVGFTVYRLEPGDSLCFPSSLPHRYVNPTDRPTRAISVNLWDQVVRAFGEVSADAARPYEPQAR